MHALYREKSTSMSHESPDTGCGYTVSDKSRIAPIGRVIKRLPTKLRRSLASNSLSAVRGVRHRIEHEIPASGNVRREARIHGEDSGVWRTPSDSKPPGHVHHICTSKPDNEGICEKLPVATRRGGSRNRRTCQSISSWLRWQC